MEDVGSIELELPCAADVSWFELRSGGCIVPVLDPCKVGFDPGGVIGMIGAKLMNESLSGCFFNFSSNGSVTAQSQTKLAA